MMNDQIFNLYLSFQKQANCAWDDYKITGSVGSIGAYTAFQTAATEAYQLYLSNCGNDNERL